jgi:hypothetical protein
MWNLIEQEAVFALVNGHTALRSALEHFCKARAAERRKDCAQAMSSVPRQYELASDYAAKADVYEGLLAELERECDRQV